MEYKITMTLSIKDDADVKEISNLRRAVDHHIEWLVDMDEWPCIESIHDCSIRRTG